MAQSRFRRTPLLMRAIALLLLALANTPAPATRLVIQRTTLAGFTHHAAAALWPELQEGDALQLEHESGNPHDAQAVRVLWRGNMLGYLPRTDNGALARALHQGLLLDARISHLREHPDPRRRIEVEISASPARPD